MSQNIYKWYVVQVKSGYENKALSEIKNKLRKMNLMKNIKEHIVAEESVYKTVNGKKKKNYKKYLSRIYNDKA